MANLDLHGFRSEPSDFGGLYKITDDLERNRNRKEQETQRDNANKSSMAKFLTDYLDPKEHLSGSPYDPQVTKGYMDLLNEGANLIRDNKGLTTDMLLTALSPKVNRLSEYSAKAKAVNQQIKERLSGLTEYSGYDKFNLTEQTRKNAFYNPDDSLKDISTVDPSLDWVADTVDKVPHLVTNNRSIDDYYKTLDKNVRTTDITRTAADGKKIRNKVKITAPSGYIPDVDALGVASGKFVPEYDEATDMGVPITHEFSDGKGGTVKAPVRMVKDDIYNRIMSNRPDAADWVRGQVMQHLKEYKDADGNPININSPQAKNIAKAILYDELKGRNAGSMEDVQEVKEHQIKVYAPKAAKQPTKSELDSQERINNLHLDLNDLQPDENGKLDVSNEINGMKIMDKFHEPVIIKSTLFNPKTKEFTVEDIKGDVQVMPYHRMATLMTTANPAIDMNWLKGFKTYERGVDANNVPKPKEKKEGFFDPLFNLLKKGKAIKDAQDAKNKKTPVYKGLDKEGNPIFE